MEDQEPTKIKEEKKIHPLKNEKNLIIFLLIAIIFVLFISLSNADKSSYSFLHPKTAELGVEEFLEKQNTYRFFYTPLREKIENIIEKDESIKVGVYFEDLNSRAWVGINEKEKFIPASLLKVATAAAALKMVEEEELFLDTEFTIQADDLNERFGDLYKNEGSNYTIRELIEIGLKESDNTAIEVLREQIPADRLIEARLAMGLPITSVTTSNIGTPISPREYSNIFKSLYISSYLSRESSNYLLSIMSQTGQSYGLREGVPSEIKISHKIGAYGSGRSIHDCGIIYYSKNPYLLCVMTRDQESIEEAAIVIKQISQEVYEFVSEND